VAEGTTRQAATPQLLVPSAQNKQAACQSAKQRKRLYPGQDRL